MFQGIPSEMAQLRVELLTSTRASEYESYLQDTNWSGAAQVINLQRGEERVAWERRTGAEVMAGITISDWAALSAANREYLSALTSAQEGVDVGADPVRANLASIFGAENAEPLLYKSPASWAEQMFGVGSVIGESHIENAYNYAGW